MARFIEAYQAVNVLEGDYVNDPVDRGGETYNGIARNVWPRWVGWSYIDAMKREQGTDRIIFNADQFHALDEHHRSFFKINFWDRLRGDDNPSQAIAFEVYEAAVNCGVKTASRWLQMALNAANNGGKHWRDLLVDGRIGDRTLAAVHQAIAKGRADLVVKIQNNRQGDHYFQIMLSDRSQERFAAGWFRRA